MKKAIIIDDERAAVNKLKNLLEDIGIIDVSKTFIDALEVEDYVKNNNVDVALVDIEMPNITGIELADRLLEINSSIHIIFVTAYSEFAVEAFRLNALDYLLKPVNKQRLKKAIERIPKIEEIGDKEKTVSVSCFGKFKVEVDSEQIKFRTAKAEELFAYLVTSNEKPVSRNNIMDMFWEDYDGDRALILFNTTLHYLKKAFINKGVKLKIEFLRGSYILKMMDIDCDIIKFEKIINETKEITNSNIGDARDALSLYVGNFLEQNDYIWAMQKQHDIKTAYIRLVLNICDYYREQKRESDIIALIQKALVYDHVNKYLNFKLIEASYLNNDIASMKKHYDVYKERLFLEYGVEPAKEYESLMSKV